MSCQTMTTRMRSTGHSSAKFGPCEICGQHASEVFILADETGNTSFGHKGCLEGRQRAIEYDHFLANPPDGYPPPPYALAFTPSEWIAREKHFTPNEFAAWLRAADVTADARPWTGLFDAEGERIGHYCEKGDKIVVAIY